MKKKHLKYAVLCFGLASMLAFAGCGSKGDDATTANPTETEATTEAVTVATTEATTEAQPEKDKDGFTICNDKVKTLDYVNVRTSPSTDGEIYQEVANDVELDRIGYNDEWSFFQHIHRNLFRVLSGIIRNKLIECILHDNQVQ